MYVRQCHKRDNFSNLKVNILKFLREYFRNYTYQPIQSSTGTHADLHFSLSLLDHN